MNEYVIYGVGIDQKTEEPIVLLYNDRFDQMIPIFIGPIEAQLLMITIQEAEEQEKAEYEQANQTIIDVIGNSKASLPNIRAKRPLTHDLLINILTTTNGAFDHISIHTENEGIFYADIVIRDKDGQIFTIDARPSDCLIISIKLNIPIYIKDSVLENNHIQALLAGRSTDRKSSEHLDNIKMIEDDTDTEEFASFLQNVKASDFQLPD